MIEEYKMQTLIICFVVFFTLFDVLYSQGVNTWDISFGALLKGPESAPKTLAMQSNHLHIGGHFTRLNSNTQHVLNTGYVSYFSDDHWQDMQGGLNAPIKSMCSAIDGKLYVAGGFTMDGSTDIVGLAFWNGVSWTGIPGLKVGSINTLAHDGVALTAGGMFPGIGDAKSQGIATYANDKWQDMQSGIRRIPTQSGSQGEVTVLKYALGKLYVGGQFDSAGLAPARNIAYWDGQVWHSMGEGIRGKITDITILNTGTVIVASTKTNGNIIECNPLMSWNGSAWSEIGLPPNCISISALSNDGVNVFIGGNFTMDSSRHDHGLAKWDGKTFSSIGGGVVGTIASLLYHDGIVYCGGTFLRVSDSLHCRNIAGYRVKEQSIEGSDSSLRLRTYPNPNQAGIVAISFHIDDPGEAELCLISADGRVTHCFAQAYYTIGFHEVTLNTHAFASGQYQCVLYHKGHIRTTTMHIMH